MAVFIPIRFKVRMKVRAPLVTVIARLTPSAALTGSPWRSATRSRNDCSKSISPAIARAVSSATRSSTPASRARRLMTSSSINVESTSIKTIRLARRVRPSGWIAMSIGAAAAASINPARILSRSPPETASS